MNGTLPPASGEAVERHPERAQAVWQAAVELAGGTAPGAPGAAVELLRTAEFDPSTLRHALTLGRTLLRRRPHDERLRSGRLLLQAAIDWLGVPAAHGEVGSASAGRATAGRATAGRATPRTPPPGSRAASSGS